MFSNCSIERKNTLEDKKYYCKLCKNTISFRVFKDSIDNFNKPLCFKHQKEYKKFLLTDKERKESKKDIKTSEQIRNIQPEIVDDIWEIWKKNCYSFYGIELHNNLQDDIRKLAKKYNAIGTIEFFINVISKTGLIDVVWFSPEKVPIFAFEIDSSRKKKSIHKLLEINVKEKYWIYFGKDPHVELFTSQFDPEHLLNVIDLRHVDKYHQAPKVF